MALNIHYIRHVPFEGLGRIENWARNQGHKITASLMYEGDGFPDLASIDWLVVMGGPMGCYDEQEYPWLIEEKKFIASAIDAGKVVLGICLGAQLIAEVAGGKVWKGEHSEIGWHSVELTEAAKKSPLFSEFPERLNVLQWHGDTFSIPPGGELLIKGSVFENQVFSIGDKVLALQFHLEFDAACMKRLYNSLDEPLAPGPHIQPEEEVFSSHERFVYSEKLLHSLLERLQKATVSNR